MTLLVKGQGSLDCFINSKLAILAFFGNYMHLKVLFEAQSSTLLHPRFHFWGLDHRVLVQWLHDNNLRKEFTRSTDDIITARMPSLTVEMQKEKEITVIGMEDYPTARTLDDDSVHVRYRLNTH